MEPKKLWIGADWKAERDHCGLDHRCGRFSTERFYEDDKGYVPADLMRELVEAAEEICDLIDDYLKGEYTIDSFTTQPLRMALVAYRGEK